MSSETYIPNPAAFPTDSTHGYTPGMELRDYFAAAALQGWLASYAGTNASNPAVEPQYREKVARDAYTLADAMLVERAKKGGAS